MGNLSGISTTNATFQSGITLGAGASIVVQTPAMMTIPNGQTLTNNGSITIDGTNTTAATLRFEGNGPPVTGTQIIYASALSRLQYSGSGTVRSSSPTEFPAMMPATVVVDPNVTLTLDGDKTLQSALFLSGLMDIRNAPMPRRVVLQGRLDLQGAFIANGNSDLEIGQNGGTPEAITGRLAIATNILRNFTMNRAATTLQLGSPMLIQGGLSLARGVLRSDTTY
ncbi:MAG: hypothetical protein ACOVSW_22970, partial [Candidatus Kapaibacteriota bacterium]